MEVLPHRHAFITPLPWQVPGPSPDLLGRVDPRELVAQTHEPAHAMNAIYLSHVANVLPATVKALQVAAKFFGYWVEHPVTQAASWPFAADWGRAELKLMREALAKAESLDLV